MSHNSLMIAVGGLALGAQRMKGQGSGEGSGRGRVRGQQRGMGEKERGRVGGYGVRGRRGVSVKK